MSRDFTVQDARRLLEHYRYLLKRVDEAVSSGDYEIARVRSEVCSWIETAASNDIEWEIETDNWMQSCSPEVSRMLDQLDRTCAIRRVVDRLKGAEAYAQKNILTLMSSLEDVIGCRKLLIGRHRRDEAAAVCRRLREIEAGKFSEYVDENLANLNQVWFRPVCLSGIPTEESRQVFRELVTGLRHKQEGSAMAKQVVKAVDSMASQISERSRSAVKRNDSYAGTSTTRSVRHFGCPVTIRIQQVKQPRGGYLNPRELLVKQLGKKGEDLSPEENISPCLIGLTVDYMTRLMSGTPAEAAFQISMSGARHMGKQRIAEKMLKNVTGLDDTSILNAIRLTGFDVCARTSGKGYKPIETINPNKQTMSNIRIMVRRSIDFLDLYGPKVLDGFCFEGGYTDTVSAGDGDFITADTLWDFKVLKGQPESKHTLQLLMYWRMGLHSIHPEFRDIRYLGIFNPRLNRTYTVATDSISKETISKIESDVIGY